MRTHPAWRDPEVQERLHPLVYKSMIGLVVWLVLSVWLLFGTGQYVGLDFAVVTLFFLIAVAIPVLLWATWRRNAPAGERRTTTQTLQEWIACTFSTWTGPLSGREAAMQILLPIAAVAIGMTIFGVVFDLTVPGSG